MRKYFRPPSSASKMHVIVESKVGFDMKKTRIDRGIRAKVSCIFLVECIASFFSGLEHG